MDTALYNGDFLLDSRKIPVEISGVQELLQRALIRLTVKKGSFIYDQSLGSRLYTLKAGSGNMQRQAEELVREALFDMKEISTDRVSTRLTNSGENMQIEVLLSINDKQKEVVITV